MNKLKLWKYFIPILATIWLFWMFLGSKCDTLVNILAALPLTIIAWTLAYFVYDHLNVQKVDSRNKIVLITGCDSGFGFQLAKKLDALGYTVFAGLLFPEGEGAKRLEKECSPRLNIRRMDVTSEDEVEKVIKDIKQTGIPLWAVVNNAGIAIGCPFDWGKDIEQCKQTFEVNVFGVVRVAKNTIPLLRQSKGRIVNVASVAGRISVPLMSYYCMSKHSVRVFSDVLRRGLYHDEIKVVTIEPTFYRTPIINWDNIKRTRDKIYDQTPQEIKDAYPESMIDLMNEAGKTVDLITRENIQEVVDALENAVTLAEPKLFYRCGGYQDIIVWIFGLLPEAILDGLIHTFTLNSKITQFAKLYGAMFKNNKSKSI